MDQLQVCNHTLHNDYIWCCPYPSLEGRFKSVSQNNLLQCLTYLIFTLIEFIQTLCEQQLQLLTIHDLCMYCIGLLSTRIIAFDLSQFPCVWISNEPFINRGFTPINDFINTSDFVYNWKKKVIFFFCFSLKTLCLFTSILLTKFCFY